MPKSNISKYFGFLDGSWSLSSESRRKFRRNKYGFILFNLFCGIALATIGILNKDFVENNGGLIILALIVLGVIQIIWTIARGETVFQLRRKDLAKSKMESEELLKEMKGMGNGKK